MNFLQLREAIGAFLGISFKGKRDLYACFGYPQQVSYNMLLGKYSRQGIASRIVNAPADALWTQPPKLIGGEWPTIPMLDIWEAVRRADILAGIGEFSLLVIGTDDGLPLDQPLTQAKKITYLQPYSQGETKITQLNTDATSPHYQEPELYTITPQNLAETAKGIGKASFRCHRSRVVHIAENTLVNKIYGIPRLLKVWNDLEDLAKVSGGSSECFWLTANRGLQLDLDKDMQLSPEDEKALADEVSEYVDGMSRVMKTRGVKINNLGSDVPNPSYNFEIIMSLLSGTAGIPRRILLGSEQGQLASEQDRNNWAERIQERRTIFGQPVILFPLVKKLIAAKMMPEAIYSFEWPEPFQTTPVEEAQIAAIKGRAIASAMAGHENYPEITKNFLDNYI